MVVVVVHLSVCALQMHLMPHKNHVGQSHKFILHIAKKPLPNIICPRNLFLFPLLVRRVRGNLEGKCKRGTYKGHLKRESLQIE